MDHTGIDRLIEVLEKANTSELRKFDSPPTMVNGRRGVWRMIRGFRTFIEVDANYTPKEGVAPNGNVLFGPPSLKGKNSGDIDGDTWAALTPKETKEAFSDVDVAGNGLQTLKNEVKESLGPDDTRRPAIDKAGSVEELVPIARSAGFLDNEIKSALGGNKVVPGETAEAPAEAPKGEVVDFAGAKARLRSKKPAAAVPTTAPKPEADEPELPATGTDSPAALRPRTPREKPKTKGTPSDSGPNLIQGALALALGSESQGQDEDAQRRNEFAAKLREAEARATTAGEDELADLYKQFANLILPDRDQQNKEAIERVGRAILEFHKKNGITPEAKPAVEEAKPEAEEKPEAAKVPETPEPEVVANIVPEAKPTVEASASDRELVQNAVDSATKRVEESYTRFMDEAKNDIEQAKNLALAAILNEVAAAARNPQVKMQVRRALNDLKSGKRNRRYTMMRLLRVLRLLLAIVPG